jgi:ATP-binding cassette subfamily C protein
VALARALYREPRVLVLDEPNAHLDAEGEAHLANLFAGLKAQGRTIVVIAHRNAILAAADRILVLRDGRVSAYGALADILAETHRAMQAAQGTPPQDAPPQDAPPQGVPAGAYQVGPISPVTVQTGQPAGGQMKRA